MKQYKLIKEYPGSPKLNSIVKQELSFNIQHGYRTEDLKIYYSNDYIEKSPDYWEEIIQKDYEILSFKCRYTNDLWLPHYASIKKWSRQGKLTNPYSFDEIMHNSNYYIYSFKRLSDSSIFTIDDELSFINKNESIGKIDKIWISHDQLRCDIGNMSQVLCANDKRTDIIKYIPKKPLFTTEDGVDIYEGDFCYFVNINGYFEILSSRISKNYRTESIPHFSTKEKAQEYINLHKPKYSLNDIKNILDHQIYKPYASLVLLDLKKLNK